MSMTRSIQLQLLFILAGTWTLQSVVACPIVKDDVEHNSSDTLYGPKAFEGDIVISPEDFERHYGEPHTLSSESGNHRKRRGAMRSKGALWPGGNVYYTFESTVDQNKRSLILRAMDTIEQLTCLHFSPHNGESNYLSFRSHATDPCLSYVGKLWQAGGQNVWLGPSCFSSQTLILHEIFHSLGMWHEQSRPDRDEYIQILDQNIQEGRHNEFLKRNKFDIDSLGTVYDYSSIMHYTPYTFSKDKNSPTFRVVNQEEYKKQGSPNIGQPNTVSKLDMKQLNRLYNCPGSGIPGILEVYIERAQLDETRSAYVNVTAYDDQGQSETKMTRTIANNVSPNWSTNLNFGNRVSWQYIEVSVWGTFRYYFTIYRRQLTFYQSFSVNPGHHRREHCKGTDCSIRLDFSISFTDACHCFSGGSCLANRMCLCVAGYGGPRCQYFRGQLRLFARNAKSLRNVDYWQGKSDPYLEVQAYDHHGNITTKYTRVVQDNLNPVWNEELDFDVNEWGWFTVQAFDEETVYSNVPLSKPFTFVLQSFKTVRQQHMKADEKGTLAFDYFFEK